MKKILIIDANSFIHRAFHALPPLETPDGRPIGAIYGLTNILFSILNREKPDYVAAAFDTPEKTFRKVMFKEYKAHRPKAPDELKQQIIEAHVLFKKFGIKTLEKPGFEADDILGTLAEKFTKTKGVKTTILTGDLDALQLVDDENTTILIPGGGTSQMIRYDELKVEERFGIKPKQLIDYKGFAGDSSDNIPGVPGVGPKTAARLLQKYKDIDGIYKNIDKEKESAVIKKIKENKDQAYLSKKLGTIKRDVPIKITLEELEYSKENGALIEYLKSLGFKSLINRFKDEPRISETISKNVEFLIPNKKSIEKSPRFLNSDKIKVAYHWKPIIKILKKGERAVKNPLFDIKIAAWLLNPDQKNLTLENLSKIFLKKEIRDELETLKQLYAYLAVNLKRWGLEKIYQKIELPLIKILADMELTGIKINKKALKSLNQELEKEISQISEKIYKKTNKKFNLNSPRQVGEILFEDLGIQGKHLKTPTNQYRTSEEILLEIKNEHPIVELILKYREYNKIKSTYVEPLINRVDSFNRIKTTFIQTGTATGRLSSENPNLQNVPRNSKWSKPLRKCFIADKGWSLVSFDYSQMELRILACVVGDEKLKKVFKLGKDIHTSTASYVLNIPLSKVGKKERRLAKTLNFGIIYGMGARAFSRQSGLSEKESKEFINKYFEDFPKVLEWQKKTAGEAKRDGYIRNLNGRLRRFSNNWQTERAAINMPIQSLEADIIKEAMIKTCSFIQNEGLTNKVRLILSIHDELLFEISDDVLENTILNIKEILEKQVSQLSVPLIVNVMKGKNWGELKSYAR
jgi:DNA polymerase-1